MHGRARLLYFGCALFQPLPSRWVDGVASRGKANTAPVTIKITPTATGANHVDVALICLIRPPLPKTVGKTGRAPTRRLTSAVAKYPLQTVRVAAHARWLLEEYVPREL